MSRDVVPTRSRGHLGLSITTLGPLAVLALLALAVRVPYLDAPLSPDEGGFLMLAGQWSPGSSLYGDYWVDRPPLLIGIFGLAGHLGGAVGLRALGMVVVAVAVVLAGAIGRVAAPGRRWAPVLSAATAAVFLATPFFGTREVNGELLAMPFVLAGLLTVLRGAAGGPGSRAWWAAAGVLALCAVAVKQNMADVAVAGAVALAWQAHARGLRRAAYDALAAVAGGAVALAVLLVWAHTHGTEPRALWDAVVSFRLRATAVASANEATPERLRGLLRALAYSGAPVLFLLPILSAPRARERGCLPFVAASVSAWEVVGVAAGGSYWWHYLIGLVPGLVLVAAALARHRPGLQASLAVLLGYATVVGLQFSLDHPDPSRGRMQNDRVGAYLAAHARPGDTGVVAFGTSSILQRAGMSSPYQYLWSLPVRVRDPHLAELTAVLSGPERPTWLVVADGTLEGWGLDVRSAQEALERRYRFVTVVGPWYLFHAVDTPTTPVGR